MGRGSPGLPEDLQKLTTRQGEIAGLALAGSRTRRFEAARGRSRCICTRPLPGSGSVRAGCLRRDGSWIEPTISTDASHSRQSGCRCAVRISLPTYRGRAPASSDPCSALSSLRGHQQEAPPSARAEPLPQRSGPWRTGNGPRTRNCTRPRAPARQGY
jgi:hypothetical protein